MRLYGRAGRGSHIPDGRRFIQVSLPIILNGWEQPNNCFRIYTVSSRGLLSDWVRAALNLNPTKEASTGLHRQPDLHLAPVVRARQAEERLNLPRILACSQKPTRERWASGANGSTQMAVGGVGEVLAKHLGREVPANALGTRGLYVSTGLGAAESVPYTARGQLQVSPQHLAERLEPARRRRWALDKRGPCDNDVPSRAVQRPC